MRFLWLLLLLSGCSMCKAGDVACLREAQHRNDSVGIGAEGEAKFKRDFARSGLVHEPNQEPEQPCMTVEECACEDGQRQVHLATIGEIGADLYRATSSNHARTGMDEMRQRQADHGYRLIEQYCYPGVELAADGCCKHCRNSQPCGNSCIAWGKTCTKPPGCACGL